MIEAEGQDLDEQELELLERFATTYQEGWHGKNIPRNPAYGYRANTVTLRKTPTGWKFRRMTWTNPSEWAPHGAVPLAVLINMHIIT